MKWRGRRQSTNVEDGGSDEVARIIADTYGTNGRYESDPNDKEQDTIYDDTDQILHPRKKPIPKPTPNPRRKKQYSTQVTPGKWNQN